MYVFRNCDMVFRNDVILLQDLSSESKASISDEIITLDFAQLLRLTKDDVVCLATAVVPQALLVGLGCLGCAFPKGSKKT